MKKSHTYNKKKADREREVLQRRRARQHASDTNKRTRRVQKNNFVALTKLRKERQKLAKEAQERADKLKGDARQLLVDATNYCESRRSTALWPSDAKEDCSRRRRAAKSEASVLRHRAALERRAFAKLAADEELELRAKGHDLLLTSLNELGDAQEAKRLLRADRMPKVKGGARKSRRGGERLSERRDRDVANFPEEHKAFCTDNYKEVLRRAKGKRLEPHEACAEMAHESEFASDRDYLSTKKHFEGKAFDRAIEREMAKHFGVESVPVPKSKRRRKPKLEEVPF